MFPVVWLSSVRANGLGHRKDHERPCIVSFASVYGRRLEAETSPRGNGVDLKSPGDNSYDAQRQLSRPASSQSYDLLRLKCRPHVREVFKPIMQSVFLFRAP